MNPATIISINAIPPAMPIDQGKLKFRNIPRVAAKLTGALISTIFIHPMAVLKMPVFTIVGNPIESQKSCGDCGGVEP